MPDIKITITPSLQSLANKFRSVALGGTVKNELAQFAFAVEREAKLATPIDTGRLRASIGTDILFGGMAASVGPHTNYAFFVHEGTRRMGARPFMRIGLSNANMKVYGGASPFHAAIEKYLEAKFR